MLIGQWKGYFFLNFGREESKITRSRLVLNSSSLFYRLVVFFSVTMASRFEILDKEYIAARYLTIRLRARVFYEQMVNEAQPSWLSLVENEGE